VSPALRVLATAALPVANRSTRKRILAAIQNTSTQLADPGSINDAEDAVREARAEADAASVDELDQMNAQIPAARPALRRRLSNRSLAKFAARSGYARRILDALNDTLASIGRPEV